ncbi:hypothetical protein AVEN_35561-1 [Araneus ventricosus]|uniref:Uncharacterized protein n=1 Tax=Araneus ventricosus TaxID=182803 RepID=A0A4Y2CIV1_ARAVE|nr:hypothetical protein AVEN_35561-1 [Araneus ventricosus]
MVCKCVVSTSQQICFASGLVDYAILLCRRFAANLSSQVCHDKIISRNLLQMCMLSGSASMIEKKKFLCFLKGNYTLISRLVANAAALLTYLLKAASDLDESRKLIILSSSLMNSVVFDLGANLIVDLGATSDINISRAIIPYQN